MLHPLGYVEGIFDKQLISNFGPQGCCIFSHEFYKTNSEQEFKRGYTMHVLRSPGPLETALLGYKLKKIKSGKSFIKTLMNFLAAGSNDYIMYLPELTNLVELDHENCDESGMPGVKVKYTLGENTKKMLSHGLSKGKQVMKNAGAKSVMANAPVKNSGWHLMGTTKMGSSPSTSVVNKFGQAHDISNLIIVDSSVFTTSSGVNPTSTIQAIALMISDNLIKEPHRYV